MVRCSVALLFKKRLPQKASVAFPKSKFLDKIHLTVSGGAGGSGFPKIMGLGGQGGSVYIETKPNATLMQLLSLYPDRKVKAGRGGNSAPHQLLGKDGADVTIQVPPGVTVYGPGREVIVDLVKPDQKVLLAKGGEGGTSKNKYCGHRAAQLQVDLILKVIADIGFVGFPNAGKSTLLRALSRAYPKVASYPFTTLQPNIGIMEYPDARQISCADLPGLIEGAHKNVGLGHSFLRHIDRTLLLLFMVDIGGFRLSPASPERDAFETVMSLNKELELYREDFLTKPAVLVVNKMDTEGADQKLESLRERLDSDEAYGELPEDIKPQQRIKFKDVIAISAAKKMNTEKLKEDLRKHLDELFEERWKATHGDRVLIRPLKLVRQLM
ncbi:GTP-binding protein 10 homolog [Galendromus occidentalis]|uniref:GTP-binding protein 10 homolog n=1 Tax=Galendromus occidentalis TaxID=34638 RepID=A0AAJ6QNN8_9ACAR|nr:GTP-binding protein 10 homolog [Galendromus occidentalis]